jgi:Ca-activated chloride channel family protein
MEFKTPLVLLLIPLVLVLAIILKRKAKEPAFIFSSTEIMSSMASSWKSRLSFLPWLIRLLALVILIVALAGPRQVSIDAKISTEGLDIVLAVDVSGSMAAEDFTINGKRLNRLEIIKSVVAEFIDARSLDRIGLVAFGSRAYTVCPLTMDHDWLKVNLERVRLGIVEDGTAIGSGISSAVLRLKKSEAKSKIIVLLTDGVNNAGKIDPITAAGTAQALKVKIYTIGAGTKGLAPFPVQDMFGRKFYQQVQIDLNEDELKKIASLTGGQYFRATDTDSLRSIYKEIDRMEKTKVEQTGYKQYEEFFWILVIAGLSLLLIEIILSNTLFLKVP